MPRRPMLFIILMSACFLFVDRSPAQTEIPPDAFSRSFEKAMGGFTSIEKELTDVFPDSDLVHKLSLLIDDIKNDLLDYDDQLRQQSLPRDERVAKLRERCIESMKRFHLMKRDEYSRVEYNERNFQITFAHKNKTRNKWLAMTSRMTSTMYVTVSVAIRLNSFLDLNAGLDPVARGLSAALSDLHAIFSHLYDMEEQFPAHDASQFHIIANIAVDMAEYDKELAAQSLSGEEHTAKLRTYFLTRAKDINKPGMRYDEATSSIQLFEKSGAPFLMDGQPAQFALPTSLTQFFKLPPSSGTPLIIHSDPLSLELQEAVKELKRRRESSFGAAPTSEAVQEAIEILAEMEARAPSYDLKLRRENIPQERRIVMLKSHLQEIVGQFEALKPEVVYARLEEGGYVVRYNPPAPQAQSVVNIPAGLAKILDVELPETDSPRRFPFILVLGSITGAVLLALGLRYFIMRRRKQDER